DMHTLSALLLWALFYHRGVKTPSSAAFPYFPALLNQKLTQAWPESGTSDAYAVPADPTEALHDAGNGLSAFFAIDRPQGGFRFGAARNGKHLWPLAGGLSLGGFRPFGRGGLADGGVFLGHPRAALGGQFRAFLRDRLSALRRVHRSDHEDRSGDPLF